LQATLRHWRELSGRYNYRGPRRDRVIRSALAIELLSFAPTGALAAAATSSLPERIGGDRNYDYRYAWIRDASMAIATLSVLGDVESAERYLSWLSRLGSSTEMPLQVLYRVDGGTDTAEHSRDDLVGYRNSPRCASAITLTASIRSIVSVIWPIAPSFIWTAAGVERRNIGG
jgi:GH15 family glucan-1,4-alpha-glucosidase